MSTSSGAYSAPTVDASGIYPTQWTGGPAATQPSTGGASNSGSGGSGTAASFQVDSDGVRAQAAIIAECGDRIAQVMSGLRATLEAAGEPWGTDDMGQKFGSQYTGPANQGFASLAGLGSALASVASQLVAQADAYDQVEQQITETFNSMGQDAGAAGGAGGDGAGSAGGTGA